MWKHLERLGGGVGTRGPGETQLETDRRIARSRVVGPQAPPRRAQPAARHAPEVAPPLADADRRTRRLHERRQVDAPERAHGRRGLGREPPVRDARPDDARRSTTTGARYLVTDTVGFIRRLPHQLVEGFAATLEETLVADLVLHVADASAARGAARGDDRIRRRRARRDRRGRAAGRARPEQDRPGRRRSARRRLANRYPGALQVSAATGDGPRRAARADRRAVRGPLRGRRAARARTTRARRLAELYALGPPIELREDRAGGRLHPRPPSRARPAAASPPSSSPRLAAAARPRPPGDRAHSPETA